MTHCRLIVALAAVAIVLATGAAAGGGPGRAIEEALLAAEGRFIWEDARQDYIFSDRSGLFELLSPMPESDLPILVACIDDPRPARATLDGAPVTLGVVCYQALRLVAYVEATGWPGHIGPLASPAARSAAKRAWQAVLAEGRYVLS